MTVGHASPAGRLRGSTAAVVLLVVAVLASVTAASTGGTLPRSVVAITLPAAIGLWIGDVRSGRPPLPALGALALLTLVGVVHVLLTSPTAAWAVDSHMVPEVLVLLPNGSARIALAWAVPVLWAASFAVTALWVHREGGASRRALVLVGAGLLPVLVGASFPSDAYALLWNTTAFGHPAYAGGTLVALLVMVLHAARAGRTSAVAGSV